MWGLVFRFLVFGGLVFQVGKNVAARWGYRLEVRCNLVIGKFNNHISKCPESRPGGGGPLASTPPRLLLELP